MAEEEMPAQHNSVPGAKSESTAASSTLWINYVTPLLISINNALEHLQTQNQVKTNSSLTRATPTCMSWLHEGPSHGFWMHTGLERFCGAYVMLSMENLVYCDAIS